MGAGPDAVRGDDQPGVGQVRIESDDDRVGVAGGGETVDRLLAHPGRGRARGHDVVPDVAQLALETAPAEDQHAPDLGIVVAQVERRRARRRHDRVRRDRAAHRRQPGLVVGPVVHRVVGHVDDVVATGRAIGKDRGDARHRIGAAVDDAVEIDEQEEAHGPIVAGRLGAAYDWLDAAARSRTRWPPPDVCWSMARTCSTPSRRQPAAAPPAALIGRLRGAIPAATTIELVFDGPPERGLRNERIAAGVIVRYSGGRTADDLILLMIDDVRALDGADGTATLLVVTDDRDLRHGARLRGARTAGSAWLLGRLDAGGSRRRRSAIRDRRAPRGPRSRVPHRRPRRLSSDGDPAEMDRPRWKTGRGATTKRGNPKRAPKAGGTGRMRP